MDDQSADKPDPMKSSRRHPEYWGPASKDGEGPIDVHTRIKERLALSVAGAQDHIDAARDWAQIDYSLTPDERALLSEAALLVDRFVNGQSEAQTIRSGRS
jgi:hypothetical protein